MSALRRAMPRAHDAAVLTSAFPFKVLFASKFEYTYCFKSGFFFNKIRALFGGRGFGDYIVGARLLQHSM